MTGFVIHLQLIFRPLSETGADLGLDLQPSRPGMLFWAPLDSSYLVNNDLKDGFEWLWAVNRLTALVQQFNTLKVLFKIYSLRYFESFQYDLDMLRA